MPQVYQLRQDSGWVNLGNTGMRARGPAVRGDLVWHAPSEHAQFMLSAIGPGGPTDVVEQALQEAGLTDQGSFAIPTGTASVAGPPSHFVVDRPVAQNQVEFAIYRDESGVISLHRPLAAPEPVSPQGASLAAVPATRTIRYVIPLRHAATPVGGVPRAAMLGGVAGKVLRFVGRKVTGMVGDVVYEAAKLWENQYRAAQGFHWGESVAQLLAPTPVALTPANWQALQGNRSLLFLHGTISSTVGGYAGFQNFPGQGVDLWTKYANRVLGFNHHTLTKTVAQNAADFLSGLQAGTYSFDIISHSRGGLLARTLKELTPDQIAQMLGSGWVPPSKVTLNIGKIALVGTPNIGTPLANPTDLPEAVSRLASIATTFSQTAAAIGLGALFAIFGGIIEGGLGVLPGLEDMNPGNPFLTQLNGASSDNSSYYGIEADFQPTGGLATAIENNGVDALFLGVANDLVVPTLGVSEVNGEILPAAQADLYPQSANVYHTDYFYQQGTWDSIVQFLS